MEETYLCTKVWCMKNIDACLEKKILKFENEKLSQQMLKFPIQSFWSKVKEEHFIEQKQREFCKK